MDAERLRGALGGPALERLVARLRRRLEAGRGVRGKLVLPAPTPHERDAISRLLGRAPSAGGSISLELAELDAGLRRAGICEGVEEAVLGLTGPWVDRRGLREQEEQRWAALAASAGPLAAKIGPAGLLRRLSRGDLQRATRLLEQAKTLMEQLPGRALPLAELAARVAGDSHALDPGSPLGTLALAVLRADPSGPRDAAARRDLWAREGVLCDELSAPVLVLNLPAETSTASGRALAAHTESGEPCYLTVRQLLRDPPELVSTVAARTVHVCENPSVLAAAANVLGRRSRPLVCLAGQPKTAGRLLLERLSAAGFRLAYHGDFDWPGLRIANLVFSRHRAVAWRFGAADYQPEAHAPRLQGPPADASWDAALRPRMEREGLTQHEEQVIGALLEDLDGG